MQASDPTLSPRSGNQGAERQGAELRRQLTLNAMY
jgi:hypothetical protein